MHNVPNYTRQGGSETVIGGTLTVESAGVLDLRTGARILANGTQAAAITSLTAANGTANNTVADVSGSFNQTILNDNFQDVVTKINEILTVLRNVGLIASS